MGIKSPSLGFPADVDVQGQGKNSQKLPVIPEFEYNLNDGLDFHGLCASQTPSALLACMPDELSDTALECDATASTQNTDEFSAEMRDCSSSIFSPAPNYRLKTSNLQGRLQGIEPCSNHARTCMVSALKILRALHMPPSLCLSAGAETSDSCSIQPRLTDSVLSTNREAVRLVSDMLECTCFLSSQMQLVLVIICSKLTAWYRAMVRNGYDGFDNSSVIWPTLNNNNDNINHEDYTERVLHQPFTVGEYTLDITLENKIRAQVVFSELHNVEALIETLSRRVEDTKFGNLTAARSGSETTASSRPVKPDETGLAETVHRNLNVLLHKQLQVAKAETSLILNN